MIDIKPTVGCAILMLFSVSHATSQPAPSVDKTVPSFEVASIKPNKSGRPIVTIDIQPSGRLVATGVTMNLFVQVAYGVKEFQVSQAPPWFDAERFDLDARPEESIGASLRNLPASEAAEQIWKMLQSLLAERCKLIFGDATKELPGYALVIAKNGPKLHPSTFKPPERLESRAAVGPDGTPPRGGIWLHSRGHITSTGADMTTLAAWLSRFTGRTVVDKTAYGQKTRRNAGAF